MQNNTIQNTAPPTVAQIIEAHEQAQILANQALRTAVDAARAAHLCGQYLNQIRQHHRTRHEFDLWQRDNLPEDMRGPDSWADRYMAAAQMELPLQLDDSHSATIRKLMSMLQVIPEVERAADDSLGDQPASVIFERQISRANEKLCRVLGKIDPGERAKLRSHFQQLYEVLKREIFCD